MTQTPATKPVRGVKVWQFALAVVAIGLILRIGLGALPNLGDRAAQDGPNPRAETASSALAEDATPEPTSAVEVLPFDLQGEVPGSLLTSILQKYLPGSTADHADDLRSTLPPGGDPRMIVIIPEEEETLF